MYLLCTLQSYTTTIGQRMSGAYLCYVLYVRYNHIPLSLKTVFRMTRGVT
jgi:hypothetical protein